MIRPVFVLEALLVTALLTWSADWPPAGGDTPRPIRALLAIAPFAVTATLHLTGLGQISPVFLNLSSIITITLCLPASW